MLSILPWVRAVHTTSDGRSSRRGEGQEGGVSLDGGGRLIFGFMIVRTELSDPVPLLSCDGYPLLA